MIRRSLFALFLASNLALAARADASPPVLLVDVAPEVTCPSAVEIRSALAAALEGWQVVTPSSSPATAKITVHPGATGELEVDLQTSSSPTEVRTVGVDRAECIATANTIALLVRVRLHHLPRSVEDAAGARPHARSASEPRSSSQSPIEPPRDDRDRALPEVTPNTQESAAAAPAPVQPAGNGVVPLVSPPPEKVAPPLPPLAAAPTTPSAANTGQLPAVDAHLEKTVAPSTSLWHLEAGLGGAFFASPSAGLNGVGAVAVADLGWGDRWSGAGTGEVATDLTAARGGGHVAVSRTTFGLLGRAAFYPLAAPTSQIKLSAGALLQVASARASGYAVDGSTTVVDPGLEATVAWEQLLDEQVAIWGGPALRVWLVEDSFVVADVGSVLVNPRWWLGAQLGASWRFF